MSAETVGVKKPQFFYGWWIVLVSFFGDFFMAGITVHSFSFFVKPMTRELGWTRTGIMVGMSVRTLASAFSGLVISPLIDRRGARLIMVIGAARCSMVPASWHSAGLIPSGSSTSFTALLAPSVWLVLVA